MSSAAGGKRILLVDDDADFRRSLKYALELEGYAVELAVSGRAALEAQRAQPAQVLITDIVMPDSDGFEMIDSFRKEFPGVRIIVVSGTERLDARRYLSVAELIGAEATLKKPFEIEVLLRTLRELLPCDKP